MTDVLRPPGSEPERKIPIRLLVMDVIGTILVGLGLFLLFAGSPRTLPDDIDSNEAGIVLIVVGVFLIVPLIVHVLKLGKAAASSSGGPDNYLGPGT